MVHRSSPIGAFSDHNSSINLYKASLTATCNKHLKRYIYKYISKDM